MSGERSQASSSALSLLHTYSLSADALLGCRVRREVEDPTPYCMQRVRRAVRSLGVFYHYDVGAIMGFPRLHLLDRGGWAALLPDLPSGAVALDVGAGSGHLLQEFRPLFREVVATELSAALVWRLEQQGARAFQTEAIVREALGGWWDNTKHRK